jgi:hypothetical protein
MREDNIPVEKKHIIQESLKKLLFLSKISVQ